MSPPSPVKPFNFAIVGGGIVGVTLAIALLQRNIPITIYESAAEFSEIGAGIAFSANAVRAMALVSPEVTAAYHQCRTQQADPKRNILSSMKLGDQQKAEDGGRLPHQGQPGRAADDKPIDEGIPNPQALARLLDKAGAGTVHRAHFLKELVRLIPPSAIRFGKRLTDVSRAAGPDSDVVLHFADGTTAQHTAVLGCDGIKSRLRKLLLGSDKWDAVFSGKCAYRGLMPMTKAVEIIGEEARSGQFYVGHHGHIVTFPIEKGKTLNVVAFTSRDEWTSPEWVVHVSKEEREADFSTWEPTSKAIISAMEGADIWALFDHPSAPTYYNAQSRICLVGDAAHASTPHQGMGAGMGIEDCYILANLIAGAKSMEDLNMAFMAYDEVRRPRTQKIVETSREAGRLWDLELAEDIQTVRQKLMSRMGWIWGIDLPAELQRAKAIAGQPTE
ncbi:mannitol 1-phosphate dehydrogenase 2 [Xylaria intraflava]|nr:mannitol 1-phosphate dehydrogenase 2 [Xylaria intraflava]